MGKHAAQRTQTAPPAGARRQLWVGLVLITLAGVGAALWYNGWGHPRATSRAPSSSVPGAAAEPPGEAPLVSPGELLGLAAQVPQTVDGLREEALVACTRLMSDLPNRPEALAVTALAHVRFRQTAEALRCWEKALQLNPQFSPACLGIGAAAADRAELDKAVIWLRRAIQLNPQLDGAYGRLVEVLLQQGQVDEALPPAGQFVQRFPRSCEAHYWLGQVYLQLGQYHEAKRAYEEAIRLSPQLTASYYPLSMVYARLGEKEKARECQAKLRQLKQQDLDQDRGRSREYSDLPEQQNIVAGIYLSAGDVQSRFGDPRKAEAYWLRGAAVAPQGKSCLQALLALYERQNRLAAALTVLGELARIEPQSKEYWGRAAVLYTRLAQLDAAEAAFRRAIQAAPDAPEAYQGLVELHLNWGRAMEDAGALAEKAAELSPSAKVQLLLSAVREESGDRAGAIAALQKALQLEPENLEIRKACEQLRGSAR